MIIKKITEKNNIDILINNAGIAHVGNIESVEEDDLDLLYNVNIKGIYNCIKATIPSMKKSKEWSNSKFSFNCILCRYL